MDDEFIYGVNTCNLKNNTKNNTNTNTETDTDTDTDTNTDTDTDTDTDTEYDDNNDNRLDEKIIIFNKIDGRQFNSNKLIQEEGKAIIFKKNDGFFFKEESESKYVDVDLLLKNRENIVDSRPSIGCNNNLFDTNKVTEYNIKDLNDHILNKTSYNKENLIKFKKKKLNNESDSHYCNINISGTWRKTNNIHSFRKKTNSSVPDDYNISELIAIDDNEGLEKIDFNFLNNPLNIPNEEIFNIFDYKSIQKNIVLKDEISAQIKEGFTSGSYYNNKTILSITIILVLIIFICKNKYLQVIIFIFIIIIFIFTNKDYIEKFITTDNSPMPNWIRDSKSDPLIHKSKIDKYVIRYKNYTYNFENSLKKLKKFKKYNKYDYYKGIIFFNKFIRELEIYNKIYCSNFSKNMNSAYKKLFIDTAFDYLKQSIKHFKYISLSIDNSSIEYDIFDVYPLEQELYQILGDIYSIGFNIIYIIGRENNYIIKFEKKYLNIFSNYIFLNGPDSFMEDTI